MRGHPVGHWLSPIVAALAVALIISVSTSSAQFTDMPIRETAVCDDCPTAATCAAARWTGWIDVKKFTSVSFDVTTVDANDSVTNFVMRCEESESKTTTEDAGANVCSRAIAAGVETYTCPSSKKTNPTNGGHWTWTVEQLHSSFINCAFTCEGTQVAADLWTVTAHGER